jgi:hypothetical protein
MFQAVADRACKTGLKVNPSGVTEFCLITSSIARAGTLCLAASKLIDSPEENRLLILSKIL